MSGDDPRKDDADALLEFWLRFTTELEGSRAVKNGIANLPQGAWRVLVYFHTRRDSAPVDVETIGEATSLSPASIRRAFSDLEAVGYLTQQRSNDDARFFDRELTKAGRHALGTIKKHAAVPLP